MTNCGHDDSTINIVMGIIIIIINYEINRFSTAKSVNIQRPQASDTSDKLNINVLKYI